MTEELRLKECDRVLEIGTGSGYQTAVLAEIAAEVYTVEIIEPLAQRARKVLERLGYGNIKYRVGDGAAGWPEHAPFDAIMVTAAPEKALHGLMKQLADGGRMIAPVGGFIQNLHLTTRDDDSFDDKRLISVRFVPLTGEAAEGRS
jgi:protein-L-isoaspartate(D-aspartate) O-methyltransferase